MAYPTYTEMKEMAMKASAWTLAISASMILGLLSFSGMLAIWPAITIASAAFIFAIIIEGEIYLQNIISALQKLMDPKAYEHQLVGLYLQEKLCDYDKNRDLFLLREPNAEDIRRVREHNQVIIFYQEGKPKIGFLNSQKQYVCEELTPEQSRFIAHYKNEQFMEIPGHHEHIQNILKSFDAQISPRPEISYPLFLRAYVSQCQYVRQLNCYTHTQSYNEATQTKLQKLTEHLTQLDNELSTCLFHDTKPLDSIDTELYVNAVNSKTDEYHISLPNMTIERMTKIAPGIQQMSWAIKKKPNFALNENTDQMATFVSYWEDFKNLPEDNSTLLAVSQTAYNFHKNELIKWMMSHRAEWKEKLASHISYSRLALMVSAFSGFIMGIGTTYLIMEAIMSVPLLAAIPIALFPPIIGPLALLAGIAYGLLIYNSLTDMLLDNPITKFVNRMRSLSWQDLTLKRKIILGLTAVLFTVTLFLTVCTAGTWLTVFHKTKPLFKWLNIIPNILLNLTIPILIGISMLPFSIQSIAGTLESLETNPNFDSAMAAFNPRNWRAPTHMPRTFSEAWTGLSNSLWQKWIPWFLGVTPDEFAQETLRQKLNPYRILYRLLFEPLRYFIFVGHLISAGATSDQIEGVPLVYSFWLNFGFECAEDWDWIWGRAHVDSVDTLDLLKERAQKADDHNHDNNFPMRLLKFIFDPIIWRAAKWHNPDDTRENIQKRYERLQGLKPDIPNPTIPTYRTGSNFNLFLFKSSVYESSATLTDACCIKPAMA